MLVLQPLCFLFLLKPKLIFHDFLLQFHAAGCRIVVREPQLLLSLHRVLHFAVRRGVAMITSPNNALSLFSIHNATHHYTYNRHITVPKKVLTIKRRVHCEGREGASVSRSLASIWM